MSDRADIRELQNKFPIDLTGANMLTGILPIANTPFNAYGQAYRTATYTAGDKNRWEVIGFANTNNLLNITRGDFDATFGDDTQNKFTVTYAGVYKITYRCNFYANSVDALASSRLIIDNTTEVAGSWGENRCSRANEIFAVVNTSIVSLTAGQFISLQIGVANTGILLHYYDDGNLPNADNFIMANLTIQKIG